MGSCSCHAELKAEVSKARWWQQRGVKLLHGVAGGSGPSGGKHDGATVCSPERSCC